MSNSKMIDCEEAHIQSVIDISEGLYAGQVRDYWTRRTSNWFWPTKILAMSSLVHIVDRVAYYCVILFVPNFSYTQEVFFWISPMQPVRVFSAQFGLCLQEEPVSIS